MTMSTKIDNSTSLEVTIISGESLTLSRTPIKKNAFVLVKADSNKDQSTSLDTTDNGAYPSWQEKFTIKIPMHVKYFTLQVCCRNPSGNHVVGSVMVPTSDFMGHYFPCDYLHFLSYRLRDGYGKRNGIVNLSVKIKSDGGANKMSSGKNVAGTSSGSTPVRGWSCGQGVSQGVVMGVPVQKQY